MRFRYLVSIVIFFATFLYADYYTCPAKNVNGGSTVKYEDIYKNVSAGTLNVYLNNIYTIGAKGMIRCEKLKVEKGQQAKQEYQKIIPYSQVITKLKSVNPIDGIYVCDYLDKSSGLVITSCAYKNSDLATYYKAIVNKVDDIVNKELKGAKALGGGQTGAILNHLTTKTDGTQDTILYGKVKSAYEELVKMTMNVTKMTNNLSKDIFTKLKNFVGKDYDLDERGYTFANFVAGLITLDGNVVEKYDSDTGKIVINKEWENKISEVSKEGVDYESISGFSAKFSATMQSIKDSIVTPVVNFWKKITGQQEKQIDSKEASLSKGVYDFSVASWLDIFELKLWGWYYDLASKIDFVVAMILNAMIFLMASYFGFVHFGKFAVNKYLEKQHIPGQSKVWTKFSVIFLSAAIFYFSPANNDKVGIQVGGEDTPSFRYNNTIAKNFIRDIAQYGNKFATALNDAGMVSYLTYVLKKENIMSNDAIRYSYINNVVNPLILWKTQMPIVQECVKFYGTGAPENFIFNGQSIATPNYDYAYQSNFMKLNNLNSLDYDMCTQFASQYFRLPYGVYKAGSEIELEAQSYDSDMYKAMDMIVDNQLIIEKKFGWLNVFNIPLSYYLMKNNNMFLSPSIDYDSIEKKADEYVKGLNLREAKFYSDNPSDLQKYSSTTILTSLENSVFGMASNIIGTFMDGIVYFMLPGFKDIYGTLKDSFRDYLDLGLKNKMANGKEKKGMAQKVVQKGKSVLFYIVGKLKALIIKFVPFGGVVSTILDSIMSFVTITPAKLYIMASVAFFFMSIFLWEYLFTIIFLTVISFMILVKIVYYFIDLLYYFFVSPFVVLWAFTIGNNGYAPMINFAKKGLVLLVYPTIVVLTAYVFIFIYELFNVLSLYLLKMFVKTQHINIEIMNVALQQADGFSAFTQLETMNAVISVILKVVGVIVAYSILYKGSEWIIEAIGLGDTRLISSTTSQEIIQKGEKYANPIA